MLHRQAEGAKCRAALDASAGGSALMVLLKFSRESTRASRTAQEAARRKSGPAFRFPAEEYVRLLFAWVRYKHWRVQEYFLESITFPRFPVAVMSEQACNGCFVGIQGATPENSTFRMEWMLT